MEAIPTENNALVNMEMHLEPVYLGMETNNIETTPPTKRRKKKSMVWEHFTIETVSPGCRRACCKQCKQSFAYSMGSKVAGTSHLKRHIAKGGCPVVLRNQQQDPMAMTPFSAPSKIANDSAGPTPTTDPPKRRYRTSSVPYVAFDSDRCRQEIAQMIILHDYPLHIVEHPGFVAFVRNLQPNFSMVNFNTVQGDCIATYLGEKQSVQNLIEGMPGRICLTLDLWTSCQTTGYVFVTGQFVDNEWKIHRKLLNVVMEPFPESDSAFSHAVSSCLSDWNMEGRLFSITINQNLSDAGIDSLRSLLSEKNPNTLGGRSLLNHCLARSLSSIAQEAFKVCQETVNKVRDCVKYVKTSDVLEEKFLELKQQLQVPSMKTLAIDDQTRWNTTYEMLLSASELKEVFSCIDTTDPDYSKGPTAEEWKQIENLCTCLKLLFDTANLLTSATIPTTNTFFHEVWKIQLELTRAATSEDPVINTIAKPMQVGFDTYWKSCCLILAIAVVMDPRFKMKLVEFSFTKIYGEEAASYINLVDEGIHQMFLEYVGGLEGSVKQEDVAGLGLTDFDMYIMETTSQQSKSELDQYLEESLLPRVHEFDVMGWWKLNKVKYPTLSKMARDILTVPVSTVAPELVFETERKEMDRYRCSLRPETVEAVICAKDWLVGGGGNGESVDMMKAMVKMEFPI
ncbi:putative transcription factor/ chromatin remodeling BED-type(Zn) family [Helianthus annuus]|uniref:Putative zinc finger, BED-type n=1 Tax=Helianthus annuus TaxID=4232 RepID=A0A251UNZ1_HELAN|nr:zinc finger BED domain-containing protein DAYSLEEPER [Helianthus annuus]KAF5805195.1 putative transcription factor/ chromatin remodeling BED-type(Zn) family [Helianthus annuus]KAJ0569698.1 putative transcription factor/ chromatin remodeling BED-type(Zn) family [Helianthus annuus]KAJ0576269.1 putative transcription factor/ chromatin remodeling BED-type(Zn) family [Helianthus annuus]KAJ0584015.1 putative transcription factor/ chromatin remodeling BED-type(Zn) family [Helianthus annuus]KAJ0746